MSAILSTDDLNDFISPSVACIKPVETLPAPLRASEYEVTTEDKLQQQEQTTQISLTDCLACSGCVTSAEAVLVSLQSHAEVLNTLDLFPSFQVDQSFDEGFSESGQDSAKIFVASVSPQVRASIAATYNISEAAASAKIEQLLSGPNGLAEGGKHGSHFAWVIDTNALREMALVIGADEIEQAIECSRQGNELEPDAEKNLPKLPVLSSACPGWICYAEKTHPHVLPHISRTKSPQALTGTLLKSVLAKAYNIDPARIWHLAVMPCFDKKLEASREEHTDASWTDNKVAGAPVRDVDCVITAREILMLAESRNISFPALPSQRPNLEYSFPNANISDFLFRKPSRIPQRGFAAGTSGGYVYYYMLLRQAEVNGSDLKIDRGRNADVLDYDLTLDGKAVVKGARFYGFRNIQNLVRKLKKPGARRAGRSIRPGVASKPSKPPSNDLDYSFIEVMACPGGCTNGGGQIKISDLSEHQLQPELSVNPKEWLSRVDEAYFSDGESSISTMEDNEPPSSTFWKERAGEIRNLIKIWSDFTDISKEKLLYTTYREVHSDVGKTKADPESIAILAGKIGGGW